MNQELFPKFAAIQTFEEALMVLRRRTGKSQEEMGSLLAERAGKSRGLSKQAVSLWEGGGNIRREHLGAYAKVLAELLDYDAVELTRWLGSLWPTSR